MNQPSPEQLERAKAFTEAVEGTMFAIRQLQGVKTYHGVSAEKTQHIDVVLREALESVQRGDITTAEELLEYMHYQLGR